MRICAICENGWIIIGIKDESKSDGTTMYMTDASVVRCWRNGRGIGGIANPEYKSEYTLDEIGDVEIYQNKILFTIPCNW